MIKTSAIKKLSQKTWLGGIYLKDEGGYDIVLRSLNHYKKRLGSIARSPELKDAPTFAQIVKYEASKTSPLIVQCIDKIKIALENPQTLNELQNDIPLFEKALNCYYSDIKKAQNGSDGYYLELISDVESAASDLQKITDALGKISQFT